MAEQYEGNGEYNYADGGTGDFKRTVPSSPKSDDDTEETNPTSEKANEYIKELLSEKVLMDHRYPNAERFIDQEMLKVQQSGRVPHRDLKYVDIYREKQIRVTVKVLVPVKEHPKFNFVGKLLGPKGNSMKRLQEETMCKMAVLGRGSMKDKKKEDDLRAALDPKYAHLNDDLHVEISALAPPAEAHARVAYALAEVRKYLIPDSNDVIRQEQMREMIADGTIPAESVEFSDAQGGSSPANSSPQQQSQQQQPPFKSYKPRGGAGGAHPPRGSYPSYRAPTPSQPSRSPSGSSRTVMPAKQKILSILDRARNAMEESYGLYEEPPGGFEPHSHQNHPTQSYDSSYSYSHSHQHPSNAPPRSSRHEEYESGEYGRDYYRESSSSYPPPVKAGSGTTSTSARTPSWKTVSSAYPSKTSSPGPNNRSRSGDESSNGSSSKHVPSSGGGRERYRTSPYTRPAKKHRSIK